MVSGETAANLVNDYFSGIGNKLSLETVQTDMVFNPPLYDCVFEWSHDISIQDVLDCINELSVRKSSGIPELSSKIVIASLKIKVNILTGIFNNCIKHGIFPNHWKISSMVPIPKKPNAKLLKDLRPISLLPLPGKIL